MENIEDDYASQSPPLANESWYVPYVYRPETYIVPALFTIIFIVGVLGNGALVWMFLRNRAMRSVPNVYIFSLALGDLLVILTCVPFTSTVYTLESWPYGLLVCKVSEVTKDVSIGVSVLTLTALSAERYCAIVNPMRNHTGAGCVSSDTSTILSAALIWVAACIFAIPAGLISKVERIVLDEAENHTILVCTPFPEDMGRTYSISVVLARFFVYYAGPLLTISSFYVLMACRLHASTRHIPGEAAPAAGSHSQQVRARRKVAKAVLAFVVIFFICFLPYHVVSLWFFINPRSRDEYNSYWHATRIIGFCLTFINSCVNPIALYLISGVYRKQYNRYLCCWLANRRRRRRNSRAQFEASLRSRQRARQSQCSATGSAAGDLAASAASAVVTLTNASGLAPAKSVKL